MLTEAGITKDLTSVQWFTYKHPSVKACLHRQARIVDDQVRAVHDHGTLLASEAGNLTAARRSSWLTTLTSGSTSSRAVLGTELDPVRLVVDVEDALLDLVVDLPGCVDEGLLHVCSSLGWGFHEDETMFSCKSFTLLPLHVSTCFQVTEYWRSKSDEIYCQTFCCLWAWSPCYCCCAASHPPAMWSVWKRVKAKNEKWISHQVVESVSPGDVVDKQSPRCSSAGEMLVIDQCIDHCYGQE